MKYLFLLFGFAISFANETNPHCKPIPEGLYTELYTVMSEMGSENESVQFFRAQTANYCLSLDQTMRLKALYDTDLGLKLFYQIAVSRLADVEETETFEHMIRKEQMRRDEHQKAADKK